MSADPYLCVNYHATITITVVIWVLLTSLLAKEFTSIHTRQFSARSRNSHSITGLSFKNIMHKLPDTERDGLGRERGSSRKAWLCKQKESQRKELYHDKNKGSWERLSSSPKVNWPKSLNVYSQFDDGEGRIGLISNAYNPVKKPQNYPLFGVKLFGLLKICKSVCKSHVKEVYRVNTNKSLASALDNRS